MFRNKYIKRTQHLIDAIEALNRLAGDKAKEILEIENVEQDTVLHTVCSSSMCSRELIVMIKDILNDPTCLNKKNGAGLTPYDLLKANCSMDASTKDKCLRLLKPGSTASEINRKADELLKMREDLLRKPVVEEEPFEYIPWRKRPKPVEFKFNKVAKIETKSTTITSTNVMAVPTCLAISYNLQIVSTIKSKTITTCRCISFEYDISYLPNLYANVENLLVANLKSISVNKEACDSIPEHVSKSDDSRCGHEIMPFTRSSLDVLLMNVHSSRPLLNAVATLPFLLGPINRTDTSSSLPVEKCSKAASYVSSEAIRLKINIPFNIGTVAGVKTTPFSSLSVGSCSTANIKKVIRTTRAISFFEVMYN